MHDKYVEAISKLKDDTSPKIFVTLKDDTSPKICVTLTGHSQTKDITKHLPTNNQMIIAQYTKKGQPYLQPNVSSTPIYSIKLNQIYTIIQLCVNK